ncbi:sensor histidine kinase [Bacillus gibsonii]|nr:sensor histidine kinase [Alkalicoccobacillus gibsonii]
MFKRFKVRTVLFSSFALFIIILFSILILVSYRTMVNEMTDQTIVHQQETLALYSKEINNQLRAVEEMSLVLSRYSALQTILQGSTDSGLYYYNYQRSNVHSYLYQVILSMSLVESIDIYMQQPPAYDPQTPIRYLSILDLHDHPKNQTLNQLDEGWLGPHQMHLKEESAEIVSYTRSIYSSSGTIRGVLVMNISLQQFVPLIKDNQQSKSRVLLDSSLNQIATIGDPDLPINLELQLHMANLTNNENNEGMQENDKGLIVWSGLSESGWKLVELTPRGELTGSGARMAIILFGIGFIAVICALFVTYFLSSTFTKPILLLVHAMQKYGLGQTISLPENYHNEFGQLFNGFQRMTNRIKRLHQKIEHQSYLKRKAEIGALQANINPHFLYNTLDQLNWMAIERNQDEMSKVIELIGKMLRIGLSEGKSLIPIKDELAHVQYYLKIQQYRLHNSLTYEFKLSKDAEPYFIPKFTLQPLIENAIIHGFHRREQGKIRVTITVEEKRVNIRVTDNGCGFETKMMKKRGYGIENVDKRIKAYFGEGYGVIIRSKRNLGTTVSINVAKQLNDQIKGGLTNVEDRDR